LKNSRKIVGSIIFLSILAIFLFTGYFIKDKRDDVAINDVFEEEVTDEKSSKETITVYVNGEVKKPGVYNLKEDSRTEDLIKISGGFTEKANRERLNLAKRLKDEDYIYVDKLDTMEDGTVLKGKDKDSKINLNKASKEELKSIPGIGDVTAEKIINYREENNGFNSIEDIKNIDRIGEKTFEKIKDKLDIR